MRRYKDFSHRQRITLIVLVLAIFGLGWSLRAPADFPLKKEITIESGANLAAISTQLAEEGVIRFPVLWRLLVVASGGGQSVQAGDYWFEAPLNAWTVARRLINGQFVLNPVKVTILPGSNPGQVAKALQAKFPNLEKKVLSTLLAERPAENFPDTYFFPPELSAEKIVAALRHRFALETANLHSQALISGRTWEETLVMASVVEEEASDAATRALIAGILWKRLDAQMPLQVDVAPETYKRRGLPELAIANPGLGALTATLRPTKSDFWYYLADRQGVTHYAVNFTEHKNNKTKYLR